MTERLPLNDAVDAALFRLLCDRIKNDPDVKRVVKVLKTWDDSEADRVEVTGSLQMPFVEIHPGGSGEKWAYPDATRADLMLVVNFWCAGLRAENPMNLWAAIVRALRPVNGSEALAWEEQLVAAGAEDGSILVDTPAYAIDPDPENAGNWVGTGRIKITYLLQTFQTQE